MYANVRTGSPGRALRAAKRAPPGLSGAAARTPRLARGLQYKPKRLSGRVGGPEFKDAAMRLRIMIGAGATGPIGPIGPVDLAGPGGPAGRN
jgi:hypothetical protein